MIGNLFWKLFCSLDAVADLQGYVRKKVSGEKNQKIIIIIDECRHWSKNYWKFWKIYTLECLKKSISEKIE